MNRFCRICSILLNIDNWKNSSVKRKDYICNLCCKSRNITEKLNLKNKVFEMYGGKCSCCGESNIIFLTIDHINENGSVHRKHLETAGIVGGGMFYRWLRKQGYPKDNYQLLCFNCNFAKHVLGKCPHQK